MGSPEATLAAAEAVGTLEGTFEELTGSLQGWKRKQSVKKGGTPKKKDVVFVAPDGEEIKTKKQLDKYLKAHPGTLSASDFEWSVPAADAVTPTENRRRSARLSSKGRSSTEGIEETSPKPPVLKRSRKSRENGKDESDGKDGADIPADISQDKEEENGDNNGAIKSMDVDVSKVEVPSVEETKEVTAETLAANTEDEKLVSGGIIGEKPVDIHTEPVVEYASESKVEEIPVGNGDAENAKGEAEIPPSQGIHALVGEVPKPLEVGGPPAPETVA